MERFAFSKKRNHDTNFACVAELFPEAALPSRFDVISHNHLLTPTIAGWTSRRFRIPGMLFYLSTAEPLTIAIPKCCFLIQIKIDSHKAIGSPKSAAALIACSSNERFLQFLPPLCTVASKVDEKRTASARPFEVGRPHSGASAP